MISKIKFSVFACLVASAALVGGCSSEVISSGDFDQNGENNGADQPGDGGDQPGDGGDEPGDGGDEPAKCISPDQDGDTISDELEGCTEADDKDGDTIPNCSDDDSDGDTIPDSVEADTKGCSGNFPGNTDNDAYPNYLDDDSDGNRILDKDEGEPSVDTDNDTVPDFLDDDDDGDGVSDILEIMGMPNSGDINLPVGQFSGDCNGDGVYDAQGNSSSPIDCDSDLIPDYKDKDSDGDGMLDAVEYYHILGEFYARYSQDTDGNGVSDTDEAGADPNHPVDTDGDGVPDFLDNDNDNDGLPDKYEVSIGSNPNVEDSDGDNASDLVEIGAGTDPNDSSVNPMTEGNFVFVVPYNGEASPKKQALSFATSIQTVDIYFSIDQSGSMSEEISTLRQKIPSMIKNMTCADLGRACIENIECADLNGGNAICGENGRCIVDPAVGSDGKGCFANMWTGIGWWGNINRFQNALSLQSDPNATSKALSKTPSLGSSENNVQPPACAADGSQCTNNPQCSTESGRVGCVGYRKDAIKIHILAGDEKNVDSTGFAVKDAGKVGALLKEKKIRYIGLYGTTSARDYGIKQVACEAGSCSSGVCASNCQSITSTELDNLFLAQINNADIEGKTIEMVRNLAKTMNLEITTVAEDFDDAEHKDASKLVKAIKLNTEDIGKEVQGRICTSVTGDAKAPFEGIAALPPGTTVCYDVIPVDNQTLFKPTEEPLVLKARIKILGDGSVLNSGIAYFVVPPVYEDNSIN